MPTSPDSNFVFHGSPIYFGEIAIPRKNIRTRNGIEIFNQESFHATAFKWIALAYTYTSSQFEIDGQKVSYSMGVSLYDRDQLSIRVCGKDSKEKTLEALYGNGGFLYWFYKNSFIHKEGLGTLEVISEAPIKPYQIERVFDPVKDLSDLGIQFDYRDLTHPKNAYLRGFR